MNPKVVWDVMEPVGGTSDPFWGFGEGFLGMMVERTVERGMHRSEGVGAGAGCCPA